jgi:hypothetical protein
MTDEVRGAKTIIHSPYTGLTAQGENEVMKRLCRKTRRAAVLSVGTFVRARTLAKAPKTITFAKTFAARCEALMDNKTIIGLMLAGALGISVAGSSSADAQSTLGGAKPQQNKIGGVAKPAPVVGGANVHAPSPPPPPKSVVSTTKPGTTTAGTTANATVQGPTSTTRPNPSITPPNKGGAVVTSNLKCSGGACASKGTKP